MRKTVSVLALIAFACDFFSRDVLVHGDLAGKPEAAGRSDGYEHHQVRTATRAVFRSDDHERSYADTVQFSDTSSR